MDEQEDNNKEFSLKGLKFDHYESFDDGYADDWDDYSEHGSYYHEYDIETLRKKLIQDIKERFVTKDGKDVTLGGCQDVIDIINKRFGVEEK